MKFIKIVSEILPVTLLIYYALMYFSSGMDFYTQELYQSWIVLIDTILMCFTLLGAYLFIKTWRKIPCICFVTAITLNVLTETHFRHPLTYYYEIFCFILIFTAFMIGFSLKTK